MRQIVLDEQAIRAIEGIIQDMPWRMAKPLSDVLNSGLVQTQEDPTPPVGGGGGGAPRPPKP